LCGKGDRLVNYKSMGGRGAGELGREKEQRGRGVEEQK